MNLGAAFSFVTEDPEWVKKLAIGSVLVLLAPFTLFLSMIPLAGWTVAVARRVIQGTAPVLPEWADFGELIKDGLKYVAIGIVWSIPLWILSLCVTLAGTALADQMDDQTATSLVSLLSTCISLPYSIVLALLLPASYGHLADTGEFGSALNPATAFKIFRANVGGYVIIAVISAFVVPIIVLVGLLVCLVGALPAGAYISALLGHLYGQAYRGAQTAVVAT